MLKGAAVIVAERPAGKLSCFFYALDSLIVVTIE